MQYRCYSCGFVFANGLPPMEALTDDQHALVTDETREHNDAKFILETTMYSGLSTANFCDDCLLAIIDNPANFVAPNLSHQLDQGNGAVYCSCGLTYSTATRHDWVEINRLRMRHESDLTKKEH